MQTAPPMKRARRSSSPTNHNSNHNGYTTSSSIQQQQQQQQLPGLSLSILGVEPLDEFIKEIADFVYHMVMSRSQEIPNAKVEVEAKIGVLRDRSGQRLAFPVLVETILSPDFGDIRFESNMSMQHHKHFNELLNKLKLSPPPGSSPIDHSHHHLIDSFFGVDKNDKIRVTRDEKTGAVLETMKKIRLGDLNIFSPKKHADWRISVNLEVPVPTPTGIASFSRKKNRISYTHEEFKIDLTQVSHSTSPLAPPQILHELEVEIARSELVLSTAMMRNDPKASEHERSAFDELIRAFVNNARILVRNANDGWS